MMGRRCWSLWLLPQVLGQILVVVNQVESSPSDKTIHIGYLASYVPAGGAINVAIEQAQNDGILYGYNFRYMQLLMNVCISAVSEITLQPAYDFR